MTIVQFFRILWARRYVIMTAPLLSFVLGLIVIAVVPPRYVADTRIMLDVIKPDPVTGQVMSSPFLRAYTKTQTELITDLRVATRAVNELGWAADPKLEKEYRERKKSDDRDFTRWAAEKIIKNSDAQLIEGSNIIDISYKSDDPEEAKRVTNALRNAYIATSLEERREGARRNADWYDAQAEKAKQVLVQSEADKANFERQNGIVLQDDKVDVDSARLAALASQSGAPIITNGPSQANSPAAMQLTEIDAAIAQQSKVLGPNHPELVELRRKREVLAAQANEEKAAMNSAASATLSAAQATAGMLAEQKSKVMAQREKVERLRLLQDTVNLQRDQYSKLATRAAELRQEAEVADTGITTLGEAYAPPDPTFPNKPLILVGAIFGGGGAGALLALLLEITLRRIRSAEDLRGAVDAPVLAIIAPEKTKKSKPSKGERKRGLKAPRQRTGAPAVQL